MRTGLQKRYIYSALFTGVFFIVIYVLIDFPLWASLIISAATYIAGIFIFKSVDMRIYDRTALARYNFEMSKLFDYKERLKDKTIKEKIGKIVTHCQKITEYLETQPKNATKIYNFLDYYLPFTCKIVTKYIEAEKKDEKTFVENKLILKMSVYIKEVEQQCNNLLNEIIKSKDKAFDFDMKLFELTVDNELKEEIEGSDK